MGYQRRVHGDSLLVTRGRNTKMMKTIAIVLLAAVAFAEPEAQPKAEADPYLLYGGYGGYGYGHHLGYRGYGYGGYGLGYRTYYGKREAEAEPEAKAAADPYLLYRGYGYGLGYHGYHGLGYQVYGKRSADAEPKADADPYLLYGGYYGHGLGYGRYGYHGLGYHGLGYRVYGKRSADADADPYLLY